jgi:hypothetical protein
MAVPSAPIDPDGTSPPMLFVVIKLAVRVLMTALAAMFWVVYAHMNLSQVWISLLFFCCLENISLFP